MIMIGKLLEIINEMQDKAWGLMGDTGSDDYKCNQENFFFGYYRALEDIEDIIRDEPVKEEK